MFLNIQITWLLNAVEGVFMRFENLETVFTKVEIFTSLTMKTWPSHWIHEAFATPEVRQTGKR